MASHRAGFGKGLGPLCCQLPPASPLLLDCRPLGQHRRGGCGHLNRPLPPPAQPLLRSKLQANFSVGVEKHSSGSRYGSTQELGAFVLGLQMMPVPRANCRRYSLGPPGLLALGPLLSGAHSTGVLAVRVSEHEIFAFQGSKEATALGGALGRLDPFPACSHSPSCTEGLVHFVLSLDWEQVVRAEEQRSVLLRRWIQAA